MPELPTLPASPSATADSDVTRLRVLIADQDAAARDLVARMLRAQGFTVVGVATDTEDAVRQVAQLRPHLLVLGTRSPGLGVRVLHQAKAVCPDLEVTALADARDYAALGALLEGGAGAVLATPVDPALLLEELQRAGRRCVARLATRCILGFTAPESERVLRPLPSQSDYRQGVVPAQAPPFGPVPGSSQEQPALLA
jgi:DNA-binding NarL/FixJ family response regulator